MESATGPVRGRRRAPKRPVSLLGVRYRSVALSTLYVGQLVALPAHMVEIERRAVISLLRLPGNSIAARAHLEFILYGAPDLGSAEAAGAAGRVGASRRMEAHWRAALARLLRAQMEGPSAMAFCEDGRPNGWDSPAFAAVLRDTLELRGLPGRRVEESRSWPAGRWRSPRLSALLASVVCDTLRPEWVAGAAAARLARAAPHLQIGGTDVFQSWLMVVLGQFRQRGGEAAFAAVKTVLAMWATSRRLHEENATAVGCLFGCTADPLFAQGDLRHYIG